MDRCMTDVLERTEREDLSSIATISMPYCTDIHSMAYIPYEDGHMLLKEPHESPESNIDEIVKHAYENTSPKEAEDVKKGNTAINTLMGWDMEFHESGRYERLAGWLQENGYRIPKTPQAYGATNTKPDAVAWTAPKDGILGINPKIDDALHDLARNYGLSINETVEMLLTHEYIHNSQERALLESGNTALIESDAEAVLANYFTYLAENAGTQDEKEAYQRMAKAAGKRYVAIMLGSYIAKLKEKYRNGRLSEEDLEKEISNLEEEVEGDGNREKEGEERSSGEGNEDESEEDTDEGPEEENEEDGGNSEGEGEGD